MHLRAAWVVPVSSPPIQDGLVEVENGRIVGVGPARGSASVDVIDLGDVAITPGLVNPHTHLELTCYADRIPPSPFWGWISRLIVLRAAPGQAQREAQGVLDGAWQSLRAGVTCVGDISRLNLHWPVLKRVPIRKVCFVELLTLADGPPRDPAELRAALDAVEEDALLTVGVSPHAPYTVPAAQIRETLALAAERRRPWCTHWAETREEVAFLYGQPAAMPEVLTAAMRRCGVFSPQQRPIAYLRACGGDWQPGALAHANYVADDELEALAAAGHTVIYCPRAHHFFGHEPHPCPRLRSAGVRVALATDSRASNWSLSLLDEARHVMQHGAAPPPANLLRMMTLDAAAALGLSDEIGSLEVGKQADIAAFPVARDVAGPVAALIERAPPAAGVWVAGGRVF